MDWIMERQRHWNVLLYRSFEPTTNTFSVIFLCISTSHWLKPSTFEFENSWMCCLFYSHSFCRRDTGASCHKLESQFWAFPPCISMALCACICLQYKILTILNYTFISCKKGIFHNIYVECGYVVYRFSEKNELYFYIK